MAAVARRLGRIIAMRGKQALEPDIQPVRNAAGDGAYFGTRRTIWWQACPCTSSPVPATPQGLPAIADQDSRCVDP